MKEQESAVNALTRSEGLLKHDVEYKGDPLRKKTEEIMELNRQIERLKSEAIRGFNDKFASIKGDQGAGNTNDWTLELATINSSIQSIARG